MSYEIERTAACQVQISAELPADEVAVQREDMIKRWVKSARIPGFRPGKAPRSMVESRYAADIKSDLEEAMIRGLWSEVQDEASLRPAGPFGVKEASWQDDGAFRVIGELEVYPEIQVPDLGGFKPPKLDMEPTDEEVDRTIDGLRDRQASWEPVEGELVSDGMLVEAEVRGEFPDGGGEPFHEERSLFQLGQGEVFPEIEAAVTGKSVGDEVTAERVLGPEAGEEREGKRVAYVVTVKSLRRKLLPEADDAFASSMGFNDGLVKLRESVRERLIHEKKRLRRDVWRGALVHLIEGDTPLELPGILLESETREELVKFAQSLARRGVDPEKADLDWKKIEGEIRQKVSERLRSELVINAVADSLEIEVNEEDVDREVALEAKRLGVPFAELKGNLAKGGGVGRIRDILRRERALDEVFRAHLEEAVSDAGSDSR